MKIPILAAFLYFVTLSYGGHIQKTNNVLPQAPLNNAALPHIKGEYIVVLHPKTNVAKHLKSIANFVSSTNILGVYDMGTFKGYGAKMTDKTRDALRSNKDVAYIDYNAIVKISACTNQKEAPWGIKRTTIETLPLAPTYDYNDLTAGQGVDVYVIDTGIDTQHQDFQGRASWGANFVKESNSVIMDNRDLNGHGTHVAGTIMSKTYGVAKKANAIAVKAFDKNGDGTENSVLSAIEFVKEDDKIKRTRDSNRRSAIVNMSFSASKVDSFNDAVDSLVDAGYLIVVAAAGNEAKNACLFSPASAPKAITVMASNRKDEFAAEFSNYGRCAHIIAPGVEISSTSTGNMHSEESGTSMAAPHVSGAVAKFISSLDANDHPDRATVLRKMLGNIKATKVPQQTETRLLYYKDC